MKQINAGELNIGYAEAGPSDGPAVLLLHGWPYDIHSCVDVTPLLAARGYRVIEPSTSRASKIPLEATPPLAALLRPELRRS